MGKVKVAVIQMFSGKNDVRKFLSADMDDEQKEYFEQEYDLHPDLIDEVLKNASIYVNMSQIFDKPEIELVEVDKLSDSERRVNGFGSTGNKRPPVNQTSFYSELPTEELERFENEYLGITVVDKGEK